jgi:hypothetical protein
MDGAGSPVDVREGCGEWGDLRAAANLSTIRAGDVRRLFDVLVVK